MAIIALVNFEVSESGNLNTLQDFDVDNPMINYYLGANCPSLLWSGFRAGFYGSNELPN